MTKNRIQWSEQEEMMANAYQIIASSFSQISSYMKNHIKSVQNGGGVITDGDMEEIMEQLTNMINKNLHNVSQMRVQFTLAPITSNSTTSTNESYKKNTIRLTESDLHKVIKESVMNVLKEGQGLDFFKDTYKDMANDEDFDLSDFLNYWKHNRSDVKNFVKSGDAFTSDSNRVGDFYDPQNPLISYPGNRTGYKKINKSTYGKMGRATGAIGANATALGTAIKNSIRKRIR